MCLCVPLLARFPNLAKLPIYFLNLHQNAPTKEVRNLESNHSLFAQGTIIESTMPCNIFLSAGHTAA